MWTYLAGPLLALLPARWRSSRFRNYDIDWTRATLLSGISEALFALAALVVWYSVFVSGVAPIFGPRVAWPYTGYAGLFSLLAHPLTWLIIYLGLEGSVRAASAIATDEAPGSLLLVALDAAIRFAQDKQSRVLPVADEVTPDAATGGLLIASCRRKPHWKYPLSIQYQDEFFQILSEEAAARPAAVQRPFIYKLRRLPSNEIIKGLELYDPSSIIQESEQAGFISTVAAELRKRHGH